MYDTEARHQWNLARRKAFWSKIKANLRGQDVRLVDFEEVSHRLHLTTPRYRGVSNVPLGKIVGSVGRYNDFVAEFLPSTANMEERWRGVAAAFINPRGGLPPIEVFKIGEAYFVKDGNHRVSVAVQLGLPDIEAYVWEYPVPISGLPENADIGVMIIALEQKDFLEATQIDSVHPDHAIAITIPGGYHDLLRHIAHYQDALEQIDGVSLSFQEAAALWFDIFYQATLGVIETSGIMARFPTYTVSDIFVATMRYKTQLEDEYGEYKRMAWILHHLEMGEGQPKIVRRLWRKMSLWFQATRSP